MITKEELKKADKKTLMQELMSAKKELQQAQFEVKTGASKASHRITQGKKYIAQILTFSKSHA